MATVSVYMHLAHRYLLRPLHPRVLDYAWGQITSRYGQAPSKAQAMDQEYTNVGVPHLFTSLHEREVGLWIPWLEPAKGWHQALGYLRPRVSQQCVPHGQGIALPVCFRGQMGTAVLCRILRCNGSTTVLCGATKQYAMQIGDPPTSGSTRWC